MEADLAVHTPHNKCMVTNGSTPGVKALYLVAFCHFVVSVLGIELVLLSFKNSDNLEQKTYNILRTVVGECKPLTQHHYT